MAVSETGHLASYVQKFAKSLGGQFLLGASVIQTTELGTEQASATEFALPVIFDLVHHMI